MPTQQPQHIFIVFGKTFKTNNNFFFLLQIFAAATCFLQRPFLCFQIYIFMRTLMTKAKRLPSFASTYTECKWGRPPPYGTLVEDLTDAFSSFFFNRCSVSQTQHWRGKQEREKTIGERRGGGRTVLSASSSAAWHSLVWCWWLFVFWLSRVLHSVSHKQSQAYQFPEQPNVSLNPQNHVLTRAPGKTFKYVCKFPPKVFPTAEG